MKPIVPCVQMDTCLFHCTLFIYMEMKWCALKPCLFVCHVQQGQWKENKNCLGARNFCLDSSRGIISGQRGLNERAVQCRRPSKFSFWWRAHIFFETMIALFVLICTCFLKDRIIMRQQDLCLLLFLLAQILFRRNKVSVSYFYQV